MDDHDTRLVVSACGGDREACARVFAANWRIVYTWMLGFTRDRAEAEDLTQQTFLRAYPRMEQLRDPERFLPWLRKIARTVALGRGWSRDVPLRPERVGDDPSLEFEHRERARLVDRALSRLPAEQRSLLLLVYTEDLPIARVADLFDTPVTTLRAGSPVPSRGSGGR